MTTELAWSWRRLQPESALRGGCRQRFGSGGKRVRRMGIGAVARQVRMALWRFLETGVVPEGAVLKEGEALGGCGGTPRGWTQGIRHVATSSQAIGVLAAP
jgi:hypothetical protein